MTDTKETSKSPKLSDEQKKLAMAKNIRAALPVVGLVFIFILFNILTKGGMVSGLSLALSQVYVILIASMGVFFIMTMGGLDFSQGSIMGLASIAVCMASKSMSVPMAILCGILTGAVIGSINGFFHVVLKIKSFIVTICTMFLFRGLIKFLTSKAPVGGAAKLMDYDTMQLKLGVTIAVLIVGFVAFNFTRFGIDLKAIGAGELAAKFAGIRTDRMKFLIYVLSGAITGFAAFINVIKVGSVTSSGGNQLETQILIALVLGGMPISGGAKVRFMNILVGSLLYIVLSSGLRIMGLDTQTMQLIQGIVFLVFVAVFADRQSIQVIK